MSSRYSRTTKVLEPATSYGDVKVYGADGQLIRIIPAQALARDRDEPKTKSFAWPDGYRDDEA